MRRAAPHALQEMPLCPAWRPLPAGFLLSSIRRPARPRSKNLWLAGRPVCRAVRPYPIVISATDLNIVGKEHDHGEAASDVIRQLCSEEVQGWGWLNAVHPADRERIREVMQQRIDTQDAHAVDYRLRHHSGDYRWFRSRAAPVFRRDRTVAEWIGMCEPLGSVPQPGGEQALPVGADDQPDLISGVQVRAARAIAGWSVRDLAEASGVSGSTIRRIEDDGGLPETRDTRKLNIIRRTLEKAGVVFLPAPNGKGGVRPV